MRSLLRGFLISALSAAALPGVAADYPVKPIRLMVNFAAGAGIDVVARLVATELQNRLGQAIVVENRVGASGSIGAAQVGDEGAVIIEQGVLFGGPAHIRARRIF